VVVVKSVSHSVLTDYWEPLEVCRDVAVAAAARKSLNMLMTITVVQTTPEFLGVLNFFSPFVRVRVSSLLNLKSSITLLLDHLSTLSRLTKIISNGEDLSTEILLQFPLFLGKKIKILMVGASYICILKIQIMLHTLSKERLAVQITQIS
jgi:hypothetical protein